MEITSSEINSDNISLATTSSVAGLLLSYGNKLETRYETVDLTGTDITITKESLGLATLDNIYFKLEVSDAEDNKAAIGLYNIEVVNTHETPLYNAITLKQELDNLNYFDGVIISLNGKSRFLEANDFFFNYMKFLRKNLNGNNFIQAVNGPQIN